MTILSVSYRPQPSHHALTPHAYPIKLNHLSCHILTGAMWVTVPHASSGRMVGRPPGIAALSTDTYPKSASCETQGRGAQRHGRGGSTTSCTTTPPTPLTALEASGDHGSLLSLANL